MLRSIHNRGNEYVSFIISCSRFWFGSCCGSYWYSDVPRARQTSLIINKRLLIIHEVKMLSVLLFPVVAFGLAVVVGRIGTVMFQEQDK